ncbi:MAG: 16S rRNA (adenine(1518)-N(6)/adenine(1519)-N(6))-dimethyltransferase [Desulfamplus sp.]|nr:16S rRNA (adenine(1518)-N(6)/adenine(1519)-N(6))-dimethyltransferase [Desulfamplus sp.]
MTYPGTLLRASQLFAKKELGQNFLADPNAAKRIVTLAQISKDDVVLEIGAGLGALTVPAAKQAAKVYAVEKDDRLIQLLLNEITAAGINNVELIHKDIFKVDIEEIARREFSNIDDTAEDIEKARIECMADDRKPVRIEHMADDKKHVRGKLLVIGNLPYNISSQVLFRLVEKRAFVSRAILMFQKELAQRICAPPGGRDYGRLSAVMQYCSDVKTLTDVGAGLFFPKPDVESRVIEVNFFTPAPDPSGRLYFTDTDEESSFLGTKYNISDYNLSLEQEIFLFKVIKAAFSKRRKTLRNSLAGSELELNKVQTEEGLNVAGIDPERRAETLGVTEFIDLTLAFWKISQENR